MNPFIFFIKLFYSGYSLILRAVINKDEFKINVRRLKESLVFHKLIVEIKNILLFVKAWNNSTKQFHNVTLSDLILSGAHSIAILIPILHLLCLSFNVAVDGDSLPAHAIFEGADPFNLLEHAGEVIKRCYSAAGANLLHSLVCEAQHLLGMGDSYNEQVVND